MCRLFGMVTGGPRVRASYWLLEAPRSLRVLSHRMPHGVGLGWFSLGAEPVRDRAPLPAFDSSDFELLAGTVMSDTFVAHVRDASVGGLEVHNCHPFHMRGRLFAHNGVVRGRDLMRGWMTEAEIALVEGQTDSEMVCAYVTAQIARHGDTTVGLIEAVRRIGAELPLFSLNLLLAESGRLWALRYPDANELWVLPPYARPGTPYGFAPSCVVASEPLDDHPGWRPLKEGELLVVDGLDATSLFPFRPPAYPLRRSELSLREAASQQSGQAPPPIVVSAERTQGVADGA